MERISIFNYEAFYLDFLEGNLNEEDTLLLMNFLAMNPDLDLEIDEVLPAFREDDILLDDVSKLMLKSDFEDVEIDETNVNHFIIAEKEELLSKSKIAELEKFIGNNIALEREIKLAESLILKADTTIVYNDKPKLKQHRRIIVLWPYASAIAAASVVLFFYWILSSPHQIEIIPTKQKKASVKFEQNKPQKGQPNAIENTNVIPTANNISSSPKSKFNSEENQTLTAQKSDFRGTNIDGMKSRPIGPIASINEQEIAPIHKYEKQPNPHIPNNEEDVLALSPYTGMHNPIEPLTKFVTNKTNTEVDFKTTRKTENERRGFYIKIGKLEISRNRR